MQPTAIQSSNSLEANELSMYQQANKTQTTSSYEAKEAARKKGKPFCKVCFDAGKPDYTSHYVKTYDAKVICPTLLNQSCLNCGRLGHTISYCDEPKSNQSKSNQSNQRTHPTIVLTGAPPIIGVEAELKLMMLKSPNHFPSLKAEQPTNPTNPTHPTNPTNPTNPNPTNEAQAQAQEEPCHIYNPKSNAFGALSQKQPKQKTFQSRQPQQSHQPPQQPAKPMTMAERLKNPPPAPAAKPTPATRSTVKPKFADLPPKSQFWWQDED